MQYCPFTYLHLALELTSTEKLPQVGSPPRDSADAARGLGEARGALCPAQTQPELSQVSLLARCAPVRSVSGPRPSPRDGLGCIGSARAVSPAEDLTRALQQPLPASPHRYPPSVSNELPCKTFHSRKTDITMQTTSSKQ